MAMLRRVFWGNCCSCIEFKNGIEFLISEGGHIGASPLITR